MDDSFEEQSSFEHCVYCASLNKPEAYTHTRFNCPVLANMEPCANCGASGPYNHTAMYCPDREKIVLELLRVQKAPWLGLPVPLVAFKGSYRQGEMPAEWMWKGTSTRRSRRGSYRNV